MDPIDWNGIRLVIFDVDGTLYRQMPVRMTMALKLLMSRGIRADFTTLKVLRTYRRLREELGANETPDFLPLLEARTAVLAGVRKDSVREIVNEWMHKRALSAVGRFPLFGVHTLFDRIRASGRQIGIFSDYPAAAKLQALGLSADYIVHAEEPEVGKLKPSAAGLNVLLERARIRPSEAIFIGDRIEKDELAGMGAGVKTYIVGSAGKGKRNHIKNYGEILAK